MSDLIISHGWIGFNLNENVRVKLTPKGEEIHRKQFYKQLEWIPPSKRHAYRDYTKSHPKDIDGYTVMQMWEVMNLFGPYMYDGCDTCIETTVLLPTQGLKPT